MAMAAFLDAFQKVADLATGTRGKHLIRRKRQLYYLNVSVFISVIIYLLI